MLLFEWLVDQPVEFFNVIVHTNMLFACIAWSLALTILICAKEKRKKNEVPPSNKTQPISNSEATSKKTRADTSNSSNTPLKKDQNKQSLLAQPSSGLNKDAKDLDEERGERKKHKKDEGDKRKEDEQPRGSTRISIHGAAVSSSDGAEENDIYMADVFDDATARDDLFPGESEVNKKKKRRKKQSTSSLQPTQYESAQFDNVDATQMSSDQQPTIEATNDVTKEPVTQTGHSMTQDATNEFTRETKDATAPESDRPISRPHCQRKIPRKVPSRHKRSSDHNRKSKSSFKYGTSKTGETATESTKKRIPKNRKKMSACSEKVKDSVSVTNKDISSHRS